MKSKIQLTESIERFKKSFWEKTQVDHPPVGVYSDGSYRPIEYLRKDFKGTHVLPEDVNAELVMTDYEYIGLSRRIFSDDWIPYSAAWRAVPWLEAICGCRVRYAHGSLAPDDCVDSLKGLSEALIPASIEWINCLKQQTKELAASAPPDCWISPSIFRGPSDIIAAMRGLTNFYLDLYDDIRVVKETATRVNSLLLDVLDMHFSCVLPKHGGYGHIFGYWAPERTIAIQEDVLGMCAPKVYRDVFMELNADIVKKLGSYVLFHLHSTGFEHYRDALEIPGIAGLQICIEQNGPSLKEMAPVLREILEKSRLILFVDHYFEELKEVLKNIPHEGLNVLISDRFIRSEDEFREFMKLNWR